MQIIDKSPIRWAGGKAWLTDFIKTIIPNDFNCYYEPFLGGASCFLKLDIKENAFLSDNNEDLINFYEQIKNNFEVLIEKIDSFKNTKDDFYKIRSEQFSDEISRAARFYYLNRLCFNGLYRVNLKGEFNVPYGDSERKVVLSNFDDLKLLNQKLQIATLKTQDFGKILSKINKKDLIFLDPPYTVAHNKNGFIAYNEKIFTWQDQERLRNFLENVREKGAYFIMTNAYHESTIKLYSKVGKQLQADRMSTIAALPNSRKNISELLVTNCI